MSGRRLTGDELRAWRRVARTVAPLRDRRTPAEPVGEDANSGSVIVKREVRPKSDVETLGRRDRRTLGLADRSGDKRVRRGRAPIAGRLDLHGHTQDSAARALASFLRRYAAEGASCVLVITGKGRDGEGVLRRRFLDWLGADDARRLVSGYAPAHRKHGGDGAWYVYLRRS